MRRQLKFMLLICALLAISTFVLSGCGGPVKKAELWLWIDPLTVYINKTADITITLSEFNGVGVNLNYLKYQIYDQSGALWYEDLKTGQQAEQEYDTLFGIHRLSAYGTLQRTLFGLYEPGPLGQRKYVMGGTDNNDHFVSTSASYAVVSR